MSGICGIVHWNEEPATEQEARPMLAAAPHRGPDGVFCRAERDAVFGYLSLEITPESEGEVQPVVHTPTGVMVVADLRLDNRDDLLSRIGEDRMQRYRAEFSFPGTPRRDTPPTDAEIVLTTHLIWKSECFALLLGDFAIAIWDPGDHRLLLARDPMAMRPLYYRTESRRTLFASEVKQIIAVPGVERKINEAAVASHLMEAHLALDTTFYAGIGQVPAGSVVVAGDKETESRRFWQFNPETRIRHRTEQDYVEHFRTLFADAVAKRLRTDKPAGISMSGGMDSGSIAATVGWLKAKGGLPAETDFRAYSWAYSELKQCDERGNSRRITDRYDIPAIDVPADDAWTFANYPNDGPDVDEPFFGPFQCIIERTVAAARRDGARILFSGDRGDLLVGCSVTDLRDLLFHGQFKTLYRELRYHARPSKVPITAYRRILIPLASDVARAVLPARLRERIVRVPPSRDSTSRPKVCPPHLNERFIRKHDTLTDIYESPVPIPNRTTLKRYRHIFVPIHMKGMVWSDRTNNRLGVGFVDPFSDRRLVEYVLSIPQRFVSRLTDQKRILRSAMKGIMPDDALRGAVKVSPEPLAMKGLRQESRSFLIDLLTDSEVVRRGYADQSGLAEALNAFLLEKSNLRYLWRVVSLETWLRRYWK